MLTERTFKHGDRSVHYVEGPDAGPPMVLVHGAAWNWRIFLPLFPHLLHRFHVFAIDLPGHGQTDRPDGPFGWEAYASDLVPFLDVTVSEPAVVVGHSLGGIVSLISAAKSPSHFKGVVVGDSPLFYEGYPQSAPPDEAGVALAHRRLEASISLDEFKEVYKDIFDYSDPWWNLFAQAMYQWHPEGVIHLDRAFSSEDEFRIGYDCETILPKISCPVLLMQGDPDRPGLAGYLTDKEIERAKALNPKITSLRISGEWHVLGMDTWNVTPLVRAVCLFAESL